MIGKPPVTFDTNVALYLVARGRGKADRAASVVIAADFISVQVLNEFVNVARRKFKFEWPVILRELASLRDAVEHILPIDEHVHEEALRLSARYMLSTYDSLMLGVALTGGARIFYSEDMQHGLVIDGILQIVNPFLPDPA